MKPHNVKGHLTYSLRRLGLDYIDLYQPARQDTTIPVEDLVGAIADQVKAGYVKHIGLSMVDAETRRRACKVHPIHTVEMAYSLVERSIEKELIAAAKELFTYFCENFEDALKTCRGNYLGVTNEFGIVMKLSEVLSGGM